MTQFTTTHRNTNKVTSPSQPASIPKALTTPKATTSFKTSHKQTRHKRDCNHQFRNALLAALTILSTLVAVVLVRHPQLLDHVLTTVHSFNLQQQQQLSSECQCKAPRIVKKKVPAADWSYEINYLNSLHLQSTPLLFNNPPTRQWPAVNWTVQALIDRIGNREITAKRSDVSNVKFVNQDKPYDRKILLEESSFKQAPKPEIYPSPFTLFNTTVAELLTAIQQPKQGEYLYFSENVALLDEVLQREIGPIEPFLRAFNTTPDAYEMNLWLGQQQVTASTHYDASTNLFTQLVGKKRFLLANHRSARLLRIYNKLHPYYRQAQQDWLQSFVESLESNERSELEWQNEQQCQAEASCASRESGFCWCSSSLDQPIVIYEVTLGPGDLLFLPSYTFHRVTSMTPSVSINFWTYSTSERQVNSFKNSPQPFEENWPKPLTAWAVREYVIKLVSVWLNAKRKTRVTVSKFMSDMVYSRFALHFKHEFDVNTNATQQHTTSPNNRFSTMCHRTLQQHPQMCGQEPGDEIDILGAKVAKSVYVNKLERYAVQMLQHLLHESVAEAVAETQIAQLIDSSATWAATTDLAFPFLMCCFDATDSDFRNNFYSTQ